MKNIAKITDEYSDGAYYFKDTTVQESDFEAIDDTIANPFEQMDLSLAQNDRNDKNDKMQMDILRIGDC